MKMASNADTNDELRPEYGPDLMKAGVRGKYAERLKQGSNVVLLAPDVAEAFPSDEAVNEALRMLIRVAKSSQRKAR